jgi:hypothetical protein
MLVDDKEKILFKMNQYERKNEMKEESIIY